MSTKNNKKRFEFTKKYLCFEAILFRVMSPNLKYIMLKREIGCGGHARWQCSCLGGDFQKIALKNWLKLRES